MKMASTPTENKPFTARYGAAPIFMLGGAPRAHEVCYENGPTPTENKQFTERLDADPIFMQGGAPTAHEVLSECGFFLPPAGTRSHIPIIPFLGRNSLHTRRTLEIKRDRMGVCPSGPGVKRYLRSYSWGELSAVFVCGQ